MAVYYRVTPYHTMFTDPRTGKDYNPGFDPCFRPNENPLPLRKKGLSINGNFEVTVTVIGIIYLHIRPKQDFIFNRNLFLAEKNVIPPNSYMVPYLYKTTHSAMKIRFPINKQIIAANYLTETAD